MAFSSNFLGGNSGPRIGSQNFADSAMQSFLRASGVENSILRVEAAKLRLLG